MDGLLTQTTDSISRTAHIRAGALTWVVQDRAAADSMIDTWRYVAHIAPAILGIRNEPNKVQPLPRGFAISILT